jgi:hypothetical protein
MVGLLAVLRVALVVMTMKMEGCQQLVVMVMMMKMEGCQQLVVMVMTMRT